MEPALASSSSMVLKVADADSATQVCPELVSLLGTYLAKPQDQKSPRQTKPKKGQFIWESETVAANIFAAINPPIDGTDPIREFSIDPGGHTDLQNRAEVFPKGKPIRNFSIDPTLSIRTRLRPPFFRTPFPRLLVHELFPGALWNQSSM